MRDTMRHEDVPCKNSLSSSNLGQFSRHSDRLVYWLQYSRGALDYGKYILPARTSLNHVQCIALLNLRLIFESETSVGGKYSRICECRVSTLLQQSTNLKWSHLVFTDNLNLHWHGVVIKLPDSPHRGCEFEFCTCHNKALWFPRSMAQN